MNMSLDEIIRIKRISIGKQRNRNFQKKNIRSVKPVIDARNKIIQKNRAKITDAREKLKIKDARMKIKQKIELQQNTLLYKNFVKKNDILNIRQKYKPLYGAPRGYIDYDNMDMLEEEYDASNINLRRTVYNDLPSYNIFSNKPLLKTWETDHFEEYDLITTHSHDVSQIKDIHRKIGDLSSSDIHAKVLQPESSLHKFFNSDKSQLSYEMRSRLEHGSQPHTSLGIFANQSKSQISFLPASYRIVVSNLHPSVSQGDIQELFEDIGELHEARLVKPGVAEVIFKNLKDAEKAVDTYHNRQLDGQPMKCLLVNPRASNKPTAPALKVTASQILGKTPLEIDIDALHKVLFRRK